MKTKKKQKKYNAKMLNNLPSAIHNRIREINKRKQQTNK